MVSTIKPPGPGWTLGLVTALSLAAASAPAAAETASGAVRFVPHRAVYEITLASTNAGSGVTDMQGRMVYELTGSRCEGWTQNMRFATRMTNQDGGEQLNDLVTSSWEEAGGSVLRFNQSQSRDGKLIEISQGDATRQPDGKKVDVALVKPLKKSLTLDAGIHFPVQHSMALIAAAQAGKSVMTSDLYDGSEKGEKVYQTTAIIGAKILPGAKKSPVSLKGGAQLDTLASWPVSISYFEPGSAKTDAVPSYELGFRFYENGVSSRLHIDYGEFSINGELTDLVFLEPTKCDASTGLSRNGKAQ
mgnify:FL=1